ncbi:MAG: hypothetical protein HN368_11550, partial [Spirochaetales bacterium]|nr:hypothetical protein [Spirochaetales bacterium]
MPWLYAFPDEPTIAAISALADDPTAGITGLNDLLTGPGFGLGVSAGLGYVGNSLGLGMVGMADIFANGPNTLGILVDSNITLGFVGGLGVPINLGGLVLHVGGSVRPMYRIRIPGLGIADAITLMSADFSNVDIPLDVYHGVGLAIDAGAIAELGSLSASLAIRDLGGTAFQYSISPLGEVLAALSAGSMPQNGELVTDDVRYVIPMSAHLGVSFHPDLGGFSNLIDPIIHAQYSLPFVEAEEAPSFWSSVHLGAEITALRFIKARVGLNQGYVTAGAGIHLLFLDFNVAYFSRELGSFAGAQQSQGVTAEVALRF